MASTSEPRYARSGEDYDYYEEEDDGDYQQQAALEFAAPVEDAAVGQAVDDDDYAELVEEADDAVEDEEGEAEEEEEDEEDEFVEFDEGFNPDSLIGLDSAATGSGGQYERYEELAARKREAAKAKLQAAAAEGQGERKALFGASVDDIWGSKQLESELNLGRKRRRREPKKKGRAKGQLPAAVTKRLGEANLMYATNRFTEAVELLREVVRTAAYVPDTYHTMGLCYEAMGDPRRALDCYMLAAHLTPKDVALWRRLAALSSEQDNPRQAIYCLTKAARHDATDVESRWDCAVLCMQIGDYAKAAEVLQRTSQIRPGDPDIVEMLARAFHQLGQVDRAIKVLEELMKDGVLVGDLTPVNMLAELYMDCGNFASALATLQRVRQTLRARTIADHDGKPSDLPMDLAVKLGVCLVYEGELHEAEEILIALNDASVMDYGDLYLDTGDAFAAAGATQQALHYYNALRANPDFNQPSLWFKLSQCHRSSGNMQDAEQLLSAVVREQPQHVEAVLELADILCQQGRVDEALSLMPANLHATMATHAEQQQPALQFAPAGRMPPQASSTNTEDPPPLELAQRFQVHRAQLLYSAGRWEEFLQAGRIFLQGDGGVVFGAGRMRQRRIVEESSDDEVADGLFQGYKRRKKRRRRRQAKTIQPSESHVAEQATGAMSSEYDSVTELLKLHLQRLLQRDEYVDLLLKFCRVLALHGQSADAIELIQASFHKHMDKELRTRLRFLLMAVSYAGGEHMQAWSTLREIALANPDSMPVWNLLNHLCKFCQERTASTQTKFLVRLISRHSTDLVPAQLLLGQQYSLSEYFQLSLAELLHVARLAPGEPMIFLSMGVAYLHLAMSRRVKDRNKTVMLGFAAFHHYYTLRNGNQEACYNLARAYHQLGLVHMAVPYYQRALAQDICKESVATQTGPKVDVMERRRSHNLRCEAAHNLALIYKASGALELARQVLLQHAIV